MDRIPPLRALIGDLGARALVFVVGALVITGYLGLAVLVFMPLYGLRRMFPRVSTGSVFGDGWHGPKRPALA